MGSSLAGRRSHPRTVTMVQDMNRLAQDMRRYGLAAEPVMLDEHGGPVDCVLMAMGEESPDLAGTTALLRIRDDVMVVENLEPAGDPAFRAMVNERIEHHLGQLCRRIAAAGSDEGFVDARGRRHLCSNIMAYPSGMREWHASPRADGDMSGLEERGRVLVAAAAMAIVLTIGLVAMDLAHPFVLVLVPGVALWAWTMMRHARDGAGMASGASTYAEHVRRAKAQAASITTAAIRARGFSN